MTEKAFAHGPWALLHSAELMRLLITDISNGLDAPLACEAHSNELYGTYCPRQPKSTHNRPLPLPDALLQGSRSEPCSAPTANGWLREVAESPWLWKLQWATLSLLFVSQELRDLLSPQCPKTVAEKWLYSLEDRLGAKMLGGSVVTGFPEGTAATTPLMTVISELILLKMFYEH